MRFHCAACDDEFEVADADRLRCPRCLRRTGLTGVDPNAKKRGFLGMPPAIVALIAGAIVVAGSVGLYFFARSSGGGRPGRAAYAPPAPRSEAELAKILVAAGVDAKAVLSPLALTPEVRLLASGIKASGADAQVRAAVDWVNARMRTGSIKLAPPIYSGGLPPRTAGELAQAMGPGVVLELSSFEVALLTTAIARAAGAPALVGEGLAELVDRDGGPRGRAPALEPTGTRGVFVTALAPATAAGRPYAARAGGDAPAEVDVRSDEAVVELFFAQRGLALLDSDPAAAARDADLANKVSEPSATVTSARAAISEAVDLPDTAISVWRSAISQGGNDAPRLAALATELLSAGDPQDAAAEARDAIALDPDQATAHAALARALAQTGDSEGGQRELTLAQKGGPHVRGLALAEAAIDFAKGDRKAGQGRLEQAIRDNEQASEAALTLYDLMMGEGDKVGAARVREQALSRSKLPERLKLRFAEIDQVFAPPPDGGVLPDATVQDAGKPKYNIPTGNGTPI